MCIKVYVAHQKSSESTRGEKEMARIKISDLPKDRQVSKEEMRSILGGGILRSTPTDLSCPGASRAYIIWKSKSWEDISY